MNRTLSLATLGLLACASAFADAPRSKADERFRAGRKLMEAGKYDEACAAFEDSQQLDPAVTTLLNLGACREKAGELASAVAVFRAAERAAMQEGTADSKALSEIAAAHVKRLEPRLSTMTVMVPREQRIDGLVIERNGTRIDSKQWDLPAPLDGGTYEIVATAPKHESWKTQVKLARERDTKTIYLPDLPDATTPVAVEKPPPVERPHAGTHHSIVWPIGFTLLGLGAGGGAFVLSRQGDELYERSKAEQNPARQNDLWHQANVRRYSAEGLAVAGLGCAGVAIWLFIRGRGDSSATTDDAVTVQPTGDGTGFAVQLRGTY